MESKEKDVLKEKDLSKEGVRKVNTQPFGKISSLFKTSKLGRGGIKWSKF